MTENLANLRSAGQAMESRMEELQLSRDIVAKQLGVSEMTLSRMFRGKTSSPSLEMACRIGNALGFTPNEIAQMYGFWVPKEPLDDRRIERAGELAQKLPAADRERFLDFIDVATTNEAIRSRKRG